MKIKIEAPQEINLVKAAVEEMLSNGVVTVTFNKSSGETRVMVCTTNPALIVNSKTIDSKSSDEVKRVFDLEKLSWRSFRWDSVKKVKVG